MTPGLTRDDGSVGLGRWRPRGDDAASLPALKAAYSAASAAGDWARERAILHKIVELYPDTAWAWYDLGLRAKWSRDWKSCAACNERALELEGDGRENASAWNLGIAATALGDWRTARRAWTSYGIPLPPASDDEVINADFGMTPVRLNPEPRYDEPELLVDGQRHETEVVWCQRIDPARAVVRSVPLPESGHRFGDVVLHDGDPVGERRFGDTTRPVFNEIARLVVSPHPTLEVEVVTAEPDDVEALIDAFVQRDLGAEDWTSSVRMLCRACSEGSPDAAHTHGAADEPNAGSRRVAIGAPFDVADEIVDAWVIASPQRHRGPLTVVA